MDLYCKNTDKNNLRLCVTVRNVYYLWSMEQNENKTGCNRPASNPSERSEAGGLEPVQQGGNWWEGKTFTVDLSERLQRLMKATTDLKKAMDAYPGVEYKVTIGELPDDL